MLQDGLFASPLSTGGKLEDFAANTDESQSVRGDGAHALGRCLCAGEQRCAVGTLLACGRVHHHLVRTQMRSRAGLLLESAEAREVTPPPQCNHV